MSHTLFQEVDYNLILCPYLGVSEFIIGSFTVVRLNLSVNIYTKALTRFAMFSCSVMQYCYSSRE